MKKIIFLIALVFSITTYGQRVIRGDVQFPDTGQGIVGDSILVINTDLTMKWIPKSLLDQTLTLNGNNLTISGDGGNTIDLSAISGGGAVWGSITGTLSDQTDLQSIIDGLQPLLVSGTNIRTINGQDLLGSGDLVIAGGGGVSDHGLLTGLADDDHPQYHDDARALVWLSALYPDLDIDDTNDVLIATTSPLSPIAVSVGTSAQLAAQPAPVSGVRLDFSTDALTNPTTDFYVENVAVTGTTTKTITLERSGNAPDLTATWTEAGGGGIGDMLKTEYDVGNNGVVDNAEQLDGQDPSFYLDDTDEQTLSFTSPNLTISKSNSSVNLSALTLTEGQVDAFVANNGYLTTEIDGSTSNELQTLSKAGSTITLSNGGGSVTDSNTQLSQEQVEDFVGGMAGTGLAYDDAAGELNVTVTGGGGDATTLNGLNSGQFLRSDISDTFNGDVMTLSDGYIDINTGINSVVLSGNNLNFSNSTTSVLQNSGGGGLSFNTDNLSGNTSQRILITGGVNTATISFFSNDLADIRNLNFQNGIASSGITVPGQVFGGVWNGNNTVPTKNDVYDAIQAISLDGDNLGANRVAGDITVIDGGLNATLNANSVAAAEIATNAVGESEIAAGAVRTSEIADNTIQEVDLEVTNTGTDNQILSLDTATGGFTWINPPAPDNLGNHVATQNLLPDVTGLRDLGSFSRAFFETYSRRFIIKKGDSYKSWRFEGNQVGNQLSLNIETAAGSNLWSGAYTFNEGEPTNPTDVVDVSHLDGEIGALFSGPTNYAPTITGAVSGNYTYTINDSYWYKVGKQVTVHVALGNLNGATAVGLLRVSLPFAANSNIGSHGFTGVFQATGISGLAAEQQDPIVRIGEGENWAQFYINSVNDDTYSGAGLSSIDYSSGTMYFTITYFTD